MRAGVRVRVSFLLLHLEYKNSIFLVLNILARKSFVREAEEIRNET